MADETCDCGDDCEREYPVDAEWERIWNLDDDSLDDELRSVGLDPVRVAVDAERFVDKLSKQPRRS